MYILSKPAKESVNIQKSTLGISRLNKMCSVKLGRVWSFYLLVRELL
jgi:hypothetical protein